MNRSLEAFVVGLGFYSPGYPNVASIVERQAKGGTDAPPAAMMDSRIRRGTSLLTRMSVEAAEQATRSLDRTSIAAVFGSHFGEIQIAIEQLDMLRQSDGIISPVKFKNSVHNTASGVFSIAAKNRGFTTSIAGGHQTFALAMLEAMTLLHTGHRFALAVAADESLPVPLDLFVDAGPLAVAVALSATPEPGTLARVAEMEFQANLRKEPRPEQVRVEPPLPEKLLRNPAAAGIAFLDAVAHRRKGQIPLTLGGREFWSMKIEPLAANESGESL